jgi:hypothetical protein
VTTLSGQPDDYGLMPLAISPRGRYLFAQAWGNGVFRYYLCANGRRVRTFDFDSSFQIRRAAWSPTGALAVAYGFDLHQPVALMTLGGKLSKLGLREDEFGGLAWTADRKCLLLPSNHNVVSVRPDGRAGGRSRKTPISLLPRRTRSSPSYAHASGRMTSGPPTSTVTARRVASASGFASPNELAWGLPIRLPGASESPRTARVSEPCD